MRMDGDRGLGMRTESPIEATNGDIRHIERDLSRKTSPDVIDEPYALQQYIVMLKLGH